MKLLMTVLGAILLALPAGAQEPPFPQKGTIELTVLFPAGSSADITARLLAEGMSKHLPGQVIVVNRPGAGGAIGYKHVASQKPDGYALVWNSNSISTTYHSGQLAFDYRAFDPVARVLVESPVLAVRADAPWKTLAEFLADAKARPGKVTVGNSGIGSHTHISSAALFKAAGVEVIEVPYGAAQVVPNLLGGHVDAVVQLPGALSTHVKAGTVRLLAALIPQRDPALARRAHRARARRERVGRGMAGDRRATGHAGGRRRGARGGDPQDRRSAGIRAGLREARHPPGLHARRGVRPADREGGRRARDAHAADRPEEAAHEAKETAMPLSHLEHVLLQTADMDATRDFYTRVLGMRVGPSPDFKFPVFWLYIGDQDVIHVTEGGANTSGNRKAYLGQQSDATRGSGVIDHLAFRCTGLAEMMEHLTTLGIAFTQRMVNDQGLYQLFLMDPNDVKVELCFSNAEVKGVRPELMASDLAG